MFRAFLLIWLILATPLPAACRHALVLALDVSGSVNDQEYRQQLDGLAFALMDAEVQDLILSDPANPISVAIFEWSSDTHQQLILNWTELTDADVIAVVATRLRRHVKDRATLKTAIGSSMRFAKALMDQKPSCWRKTIDVSGDGKNNDGPLPREVYDIADFEAITVNALVVTLPDNKVEGRLQDPQAAFKRKEMQAYYDRVVIWGDGAFSMVALGYQDYARAMKEKLIRELQPMLVGGVIGGQTGG